jgi:hypothetical protein
MIVGIARARQGVDAFAAGRCDALPPFIVDRSAGRARIVD